MQMKADIERNDEWSWKTTILLDYKEKNKTKIKNEKFFFVAKYHDESYIKKRDVSYT